MTQIQVFQPKNEHVEEVNTYINVQGDDPTDEILSKWYTPVLKIEENQFPLSDVDLLIDSIETLVNASSTKVKAFGPLDVIKVKSDQKQYRVLLLDDEEYEVI